MTTHRTFDVWAPNATEGVDLVIGGQRVPMHRSTETDLAAGPRAGIWSATAPADAGVLYGFSIDGGPTRPDPRGLRLPDGPHGLTQVYYHHDFAWSDGDWTGVPLAGAVFYEMHVGTFTEGRTFDSAIEKLDHIVELGVDIVEVMPVAAFPGTHGWGYDGVAPYATHEPYGGPDAFKRFVDACHARGLGVCLDVVYNHLGPDGNYLNDFGPYFSDRHHTPWGWALNLDGPGSDAVRRYVIDNALGWFRDFHIDALRLDAVHELHDDRALSILEELMINVENLEEDLDRTLLVIAESDRNDPRTVTARDKGGLGLDGQWADDVHHALHVALTGETHGYYGDFADPAVLPRALRRPFRHDGNWSTFRARTHGRPVDPELVSGESFVVSLQTHDQVGNRGPGDRLSAGLNRRRLCVGAALLLTGPYTPMLFMGEEWGASTPWQYFTDHVDPELAEAVRQGRFAEFATHGWEEGTVPDPQSVSTVEASTLDWSEPTRGRHERLLSWYKALLALRSNRPELSDGDLSQVRVSGDTTPGAFVVHRGRHRVAVNLSAEPVTLDLHLEGHVPGHGRTGTVLLSLDPTVSVREGSITVPADGVVVVGPSV